jgi:hypothetical protein
MSHHSETCLKIAPDKFQEVADTELALLDIVVLVDAAQARHMAECLAFDESIPLASC